MFKMAEEVKAVLCTPQEAVQFLSGHPTSHIKNKWFSLILSYSRLLAIPILLVVVIAVQVRLIMISHDTMQLNAPVATLATITTTGPLTTTTHKPKLDCPQLVHHLPEGVLTLIFCAQISNDPTHLHIRLLLNDTYLAAYTSTKFFQWLSLCGRGTFDVYGNCSILIMNTNVHCWGHSRFDAVTFLCFNDTFGVESLVINKTRFYPTSVELLVKVAESYLSRYSH